MPIIQLIILYTPRDLRERQKWNYKKIIIIKRRQRIVDNKRSGDYTSVPLAIWREFISVNCDERERWRIYIMAWLCVSAVRRQRRNSHTSGVKPLSLYGNSRAMSPANASL